MNLYPHFRLLHRIRPRPAWTLELSLDDQRKIWSIPHGPLLHPHERHLAIELVNGIEAPESFADCWDAGPAEIRKWTSRQIVAVLHGAKLRGCFSLVRFHHAGQPHWLWVRVNPRAQQPRRTRAVFSAAPLP
ncbi:hypothetical protein [Oleiharenicola sp. Vm1]|uniref:hypothetical protein n=1 Tax=Oleiharenicola sp. Vm1 TaxID=3398393 RepID=UPI0039F54581